jgi:hypothetical protein
MNQKASDTLNLTIQEYACIFHTSKGKQPINWKRVEDKLQKEMEWTQEGASQVAALAREYGAFVLRNALALATILGVEDGSLGL